MSCGGVERRWMVAFASRLEDSPRLIFEVESPAQAKDLRLERSKEHVLATKNHYDWNRAEF